MSGPRRLPSLYMGPTLFFADRQITNVVERFRLIIAFAERSIHEAVYTVQAVRIGDTYGLYARDFFDRSVFRRRLRRQGVELSTSPFTVFQSGSFGTSDWGTFDIGFAIFNDRSPDDSTPYVLGPGEVGFALMTYRMGRPDSHEFRQVLAIGSRLLPLAKEDASEIVDRVKSLRASSA